MINDYQTNIVYLAEGIRHYRPMAVNLMNQLLSENIEVRFLRHTDSSKHVWARDYMPIQIDVDRFVQYCYAPDYLKDDPEYIPPYETICRGLHLSCKKTDLVIDGGNVVRCGRRIIMTDKVFKENPSYSENRLLELLEEAFECEICLIPWDRYEMFGHADGMVRSIGNDTVLINNYADIDIDLRYNLRRALEKKGFRVRELHYDQPRGSRFSWAYLNFLQVKNRIFVPGLGIREDALALEQIQQFYPDHKVIQVRDCQNLVRDGGALNCISWTVKTESTDSMRNNDIPR